jgi:hypothetical protein
MRFKTVALIITASILLSSCYPIASDYTRNQERRKHVSGFDFRPYLDEGFVVSPYELKDDSPVLGEIKIQNEPQIIAFQEDGDYKELRERGYFERKGYIGATTSGVQIPFRYLVEPIDERKCLDDLVTIAKQMGGNGLASFKSEYIRTDYRGHFYYYTLEVSGLVFKRTEPKRPDQP